MEKILYRCQGRCALYYSMAKMARSPILAIYSIPTHDKHQWLLLQFIVLLMMDAKSVRHMSSILVVVNKHNTARVASCWFIIYYKHTKIFQVVSFI